MVINGATGDPLDLRSHRSSGHGHSSPTDSFTWNILRGTGAYTKLHGSGSGVGDELETGINDHFTGSVHFD